MISLRWHKHGLIYTAPSTEDWSVSHAQVPSALLLDDRIRLYYATRDGSGRSRTSFIDVCRENPHVVLYRNPRPVMELGNVGTHDEDGVMVGCVVQDGDRTLMYYTGWSRCSSVPYRVAIGLAISCDGGVKFSRAFEGPIVDRKPQEPHMTMSPCVLRGGDGVWRMWYGSGTQWIEIDGKREPIYVIKYAHSFDGVYWQQDNVVCVEPLHALEANTRPGVLATADGFEMWFSYRHSQDFRDGSGAYRIGHSRSRDGVKWERFPDPEGLEPGSHGWDSRMVAYPNVIHVDGRILMFYNGNGFGRSGFGFAELVSCGT